MSQRLSTTFSTLKSEAKSAFIPFIMGGDSSLAASLSLLKKLPENGADIIEIGMPFSDPMADGPTIEAAGQRALEAGTTLKDVLQMIASFREENQHTPIILMGYYNPLYRYDIAQLSADAEKAGVDGFIIVDLPPEEEAEVTPHFKAHNLDLIRLIAPTTTSDRQAYVTEHASGFVYYVSVKGITGGKAAAVDDLDDAVARLKGTTPLPVAIGFGIKTPEQAAEVSQVADAVVVGSAIVQRFHEEGESAALALVKSLADAVRA